MRRAPRAAPVLLTALFAIAAFSSCARTSQTPAPARESQTPKNVILVIGDGFGVQQLGLLDEYARRAPSSPYPNGEAALAKLMKQGHLALSQTGTAQTLVVDSAASATQLASGVGGRNGAVGVDSQGEPVSTLIDDAITRGLATGIVSDARITHATPAAFGAHAGTRHDETAIAEQLAVSDVQVLLGGGAKFFSDALLERARAQGKAVLTSRKELDRASSGKLLGLFSSSGMMDQMTMRAQRNAAQRTEPTLTEMVRAALDRLQTDPDGFVLIIEAAQIDWAGHANDAGWMLNELLKLDETVGVLHEVVEERDDTLLLITGDHETGGFGFTYRTGPTVESMKYDPRLDYGDPRDLDILAAQRHSADWLTKQLMADEEPTTERLQALVETMTDIPLTQEEAKSALTPLRDSPGASAAVKEVRTRVMRTLASKIRAIWSTTGHTSTPVPVISFGPGAEQFTGLTSHLEIGRRLRELLR